MHYWWLGLQEWVTVVRSMRQLAPYAVARGLNVQQGNGPSLRRKSDTISEGEDGVDQRFSVRRTL